MAKLEEKLDYGEVVQRLAAIEELCKRTLTSGRPMLNYEYDLLRQIKSIASCDDEPFQRISEMKPQPLEHVIISCDASVTKNPGGQVAVGAVIEYKDEPPVECFRRIKKSKTNNQGEYDAIYFGLTQLFGLKHNPGCLVEVRSDSKLVVEQLNMRICCNDETLRKKRDNILELIENVPVPVRIVWRPRNSTPALTQANYLAQDALGIRRH